MSILVTGAAGFIGSALSRALLARGDRVVGLDDFNAYYDPALKEARAARLTDQANFTMVRADIADKEAVLAATREHGPFRRIVHLAAQAGVRYSLENPMAYVQTNLVGQLNILELCRQTEGFEHLVYASSSSVYGGNTKLPFALDDRVDTPVSIYAATKRADELIEENQVAFEPRDRVRILHELHQLIHEEQPYTFFYSRRYPAAWQPELDDVRFQEIFPYVDPQAWTLSERAEQG